jgi:hypothetical protein
MSNEYLADGTTLSDHELTLAISGDTGSVSRRLIEAIRPLGYKVIGEQPLYAKRGAQGAARWNSSFNILDYPTRLSISLKQINDSAVLATFTYEVKSCVHMTSGDRQTLTREAEAIAALATERLAVSTCPACGTKIGDESRFCRVCGAPLVFEVPELEVLRLTRGARSSYHSIIFGLLFLFLTALTTLPVFVVNGARILAPLVWAGIPFGVLGLVFLFQGLLQLHRTLNPKVVKNLQTRSQPAVMSSVTRALPPSALNGSVTEGTTQLLFADADEREAVPVSRKGSHTAELDNERLM